VSVRLTPSLDKLIEQVKQANEQRTCLSIKGHGTKRFLGSSVKSIELSTQSLDQIISYDPSELVVTVQAGVSLLELEALLAESGQRLSFEPPLFMSKNAQHRGSVGGMIASGLAGARRPWSGAVRDSVLGLHLINGSSDYLRFGGEVMKNVAGYDVSRLMVGARGCLGLITQVSLKVQPLPQEVSCFAWDCSSSSLLERYAQWQRSMSPVTGLAHDGVRAYLRLEGGKESLSLFASRNGLARYEDDGVFWQGLRNHTLSFFDGNPSLWRLSLPPLTDLSDELEAASIRYLLDWAGAQYWLKSDNELLLRSIAEKYGGSIESYSNIDSNNLEKELSELASPLVLIHQRLKKAYDPNAVFNVGYMHESF